MLSLAAGIIDDYERWHHACRSTAQAATAPLVNWQEAADLLRGLSARLARGATPWPSPRYLAHLTADTPAAVALAYFAGLLYNPNNVAAEASPVTTELEHAVGEDLCTLIGFPPDRAWGHLTSGGHAANYEALWAARNLCRLAQAAASIHAASDLVPSVPDRVLANLPPHRLLDLAQSLAARGLLDTAREQAARLRARHGPGRLLLSRTAHTSWRKCADLLGFPPDDVVVLPVDRRHRMDLTALQREIRALHRAGQPIAAVVAQAGSCGEGAVDDLAQIADLREQCEREHGTSFTLHADAALGGYFRSLCVAVGPAPDPGDDRRPRPPAAGLSPDVHRSLLALARADSVTVDPHKAGHAPYPAGALVFRDRRATLATSVQPVYFASESRPATPGEHLPYGPNTLEGARPGAAAAAVWAAHRLIGLDGGGYRRTLGRWLDTARSLHDALNDAPTVHPQVARSPLHSCFPPDLNILNLTSGDAELDSALIRHFSATARVDPLGSLHLSTNRLHAGQPGGGTVLRACIMKPLATTDQRAVLTRLHRACETLAEHGH